MNTFERIIVELQRIAPRCQFEGATARRCEERWRAELRQLKRELENIRCRALVVYNRPMSLVSVERAEQWSPRWMKRHFMEKFNRPSVVYVRPDGTWDINYMHLPGLDAAMATIPTDGYDSLYPQTYPYRSSLWLNSLYGYRSMFMCIPE